MTRFRHVFIRHPTGRNTEPCVAGGMAGSAAKKAMSPPPALLEPRQGRHRVAQGVSPGLKGPHPASGTPVPPGGRGDGGEGGSATHGLEAVKES
jgi:hypothetical protein